MGASWNPDLIEQVGQALGEETRAMGCDILLGPCVNIVRDPRGGRNFETFSEDPYLSGRTAVAYIRGVQSRGVGTSLKHYAANNYEVERFRASTNVDERTLREIYLAQFEMAVKEAEPWTVMCSYNRINGVYASQNNHLQNEILKQEWGYQGAVISDWGANHSIFESIAGGLDLEMPGPAKYGKLLVDAVHIWQIDEETVNNAVRRVLRLVLLSGRMDGMVSTGSVNTKEHQALARRLAEEAITLLKNEGSILPLSKEIKSLAVLGPNAAEPVIQGGGSSHVPPFYRVSPLQALQELLGVKVAIEHEAGCENSDSPFIIPTPWLKDGFRALSYEAADFSGEPLLERRGLRSEFWWNIDWTPLQVKPRSVRLAGSLCLPADGEYRLTLNHTGRMRIMLDGEVILESEAAHRQGEETWAQASVARKLQGGKPHELTLEYIRHEGQALIAYQLGLMQVFENGKDSRLERAVELARRCDAAVIFAGYPESYESEGGDRPSIDLMGRQNELIAAVTAANPRTVVVLNVGAPVTMPWIASAPAVVQAYYPGMENGHAVAAVLFGEVNPSGKLPVSFPVRLEDCPSFINASYPGCREVNYGEGVFMGYRYYDKRGMTPLFPFGHGLSYTTFEYSDLKVPAAIKAGKPLRLSLQVKNTGKVPGKEVVQLYVSDLQSSLPRPPKELKGFTKIELAPGETGTVEFTLDERSLAFYEPRRKKWLAEPGEFELSIGSSSRDIRLRAKFTLME